MLKKDETSITGHFLTLHMKRLKVRLIVLKLTNYFPWRISEIAKHKYENIRNRFLIQRPEAEEIYKARKKFNFSSPIFNRGETKKPGYMVLY